MLAITSSCSPTLSRRNCCSAKMSSGPTSCWRSSPFWRRTLPLPTRNILLWSSPACSTVSPDSNTSGSRLRTTLSKNAIWWSSLNVSMRTCWPPTGSMVSKYTSSAKPSRKTLCLPTSRDAWSISLCSSRTGDAWHLPVCKHAKHTAWSASFCPSSLGFLSNSSTLKSPLTNTSLPTQYKSISSFAPDKCRWCPFPHPAHPHPAPATFFGCGLRYTSCSLCVPELILTTGWK
mmetsp:Transcript_7113/g.14162  ORF Transcript_7113/g.14162 Transcript_7113/m.14162 type:complete len:232 (-) Transcript_7113:734-1429(-)